MFRVEIEEVDGKTFFYGGRVATEWSHPEEADALAERLWRTLQHSASEEYARFSVIEQDGTVYSDWEV